MFAGRYTYVALFSHFIPCGVWETVYILDGLLNNASDIQPDTLRADTQGQSAPVFGLAYLRGASRGSGCATGHPSPPCALALATSRRSPRHVLRPPRHGTSAPCHGSHNDLAPRCEGRLRCASSAARLAQPALAWLSRAPRLGASRLPCLVVGIELMPRIRNWKDLKLFRLRRGARYAHIDEFFSEAIDWEFIQRHLPDMLRRRPRAWVSPLHIDQWISIVSSHFPRLSKPLATGLALWSFGMIVARSCGLTAIAGILAPLLGQSFNTVRERLRDTYREADAKAGACRSELEVSECWAPWLAWVLEGWSGQQLAIAIDATTLGQRFIVRAISVVYRGCAVLVAWKILRATEKHPWQPEWLALLERFKGVVPAHWVVIVLAVGAWMPSGCLRPLLL